MILIAHRGNINGPNFKMENKPDYILNAITAGFDVEIDVWFYNNDWFLGHDEPQYKIDQAFLNNKQFWIHCKHYDSLVRLNETDLNYFYHTDEDYVLTSKNYIWAYPGMPGGKNTICVMPEWKDYSTEEFAGVCSDYIGDYI